MNILLTTSYPTSLSQVADELGVRVRTAPTPAGMWGIYDHRHKLVTMMPGLGVAQYRSTLAHELGHAYYGHVGHAAKFERQADKWAAKHLLNFEQVAEQLRFSSDINEVASELGVLPWVLRTFVGTLSFGQTKSLLELAKTAHA